MTKAAYNTIIITLIAFAVLFLPSSFSWVESIGIFMQENKGAFASIYISIMLISSTVLVRYFWIKRLWFVLVSIIILDLSQIGYELYMYFVFDPSDWQDPSYGYIFLLLMLLNLIYAGSLMATKNFKWLKVNGIAHAVLIVMTIIETFGLLDYLLMSVLWLANSGLFIYHFIYERNRLGLEPLMKDNEEVLDF